MRIVIGCSGGLDSTYVAGLLSENHEVCGVSLKMSDHTDTALARESCEVLGIPFVELDVRDDFNKYVVDNFVDEYRRARTPNPCIMCNRYVKIRALCDYAADNGFDCVATGHYCRIENHNGRYCVVRGTDERKDQSYMLWQLTQDQLSKLMTPLGDSVKDEVRESAYSQGLKAASLKESQDICFIPGGDYVSFIKKKTGEFPEGDFIDADGTVLGRHKGIINYTLGQRKGLGIALGQPMFVVAIDPVANTVTLAKSGEEYMSSFSVSGLVFQQQIEQNGEFDDLCVKIRYAARPVPCRVRIENGMASVSFLTPQRAVTPGQSAVFYRGDSVAFGGFID
ncbi:MAG: tRNA 2-thiouridine(34) synthase MnmA [Clostridia bacterium]|nr:tRNA 2-thiouridine(34) synthase MnmA [Clostridia bacterium]